MQWIETDIYKLKISRSIDIRHIFNLFDLIIFQEPIANSLYSFLLVFPPCEFTSKLLWMMKMCPQIMVEIKGTLFLSVIDLYAMIHRLLFRSPTIMFILEKYRMQNQSKSIYSNQANLIEIWKFNRIKTIKMMTDMN